MASPTVPDRRRHAGRRRGQGWYARHPWLNRLQQVDHDGRKGRHRDGGRVPVIFVVWRAVWHLVLRGGVATPTPHRRRPGMVAW